MSLRRKYVYDVYMQQYMSQPELGAIKMWLPY